MRVILEAFAFGERDALLRIGVSPFPISTQTCDTSHIHGFFQGSGKFGLFSGDFGFFSSTFGFFFSGEFGLLVPIVWKVIGVLSLACGTASHTVPIVRCHCVALLLVFYGPTS